MGFRKDDNAFVWVSDPLALQAAADGLSGELIQKRLNYWTTALGPKFSKRDRRAAKLERSYYVHQVEYCQNFIFKRHHPIRKIFERSCELGLWRMTGERIWRAFGRGHRDRINGKLQTIMESIEHGQHVFRAYWKHAWIKQYEKYSTFLRNEVTSNNLRDFKLAKGVAHLGQMRTRFLQVLDHFAAHQAENLNVHEEFALLRRIALPVTAGGVRTPGIRIQDLRIIRLLEVRTVARGHRYWRLVYQSDSCGSPGSLRVKRTHIPSQQLALRFAQVERARLTGTTGWTLHLSPDRKGSAGGYSLSSLPPAPLRAGGRQPVPAPPR